MKNVKFDGKDYPNEGPNAGRGASSSIRRVDERTLVITDKYDGKVTDSEEIGPLDRSEDPDYRGAHCRPRQAECDGVRAEVAGQIVAQGQLKLSGDMADGQVRSRFPSSRGVMDAIIRLPGLLGWAIFGLASI